MPQPTVLISKKLQLLVNTSGIGDAEFVRAFAETYRIRENIVHDWLHGERTPYKKNLDKLAEFWSKHFPGLTSASFLMEMAEFEHSLERNNADSEGLTLPMDVVALTHEQLDTWTGTYCLTRYATTQTASLVRESMSISPITIGNKQFLEAEVHSVTGNDMERFIGRVALRGGRTFIMLTSDDPRSSSMRFITLQEKLPAKSKSQDTDRNDANLIVGTLSGTFGRDEIPAMTRIAIQRVGHAPSKRPSDITNVGYIDPADAEKNVLIALSASNTFGTTQYNNSTTMPGTSRQTE